MDLKSLAEHRNPKLNKSQKSLNKKKSKKSWTLSSFNMYLLIFIALIMSLKIILILTISFDDPE